MPVIIAADIGGTNCRYALFQQDGRSLAIQRLIWIATSKIADTGELVASIEHELNIELREADMLVAAIAGPVCANAGHLSNCALELDFRKLAAPGKKPSVCLINDFTAQAYAILEPSIASQQKIAGNAQGPANAVRAVIGAGTGLGYATLAPHFPGGASAVRWQALPSENGHAAFPFIGGEENEFHMFLCSEYNLPYACGDDVLSGRGLSALHAWLTGQKLPPAAVGSEALGFDTETLSWYSRFYGRACRNWILSSMCAGGLWITGGIAAQNPLCVASGYFFDELYYCSGWEKFLKSIPVYLQCDKNSGLWGAARFALECLAAKG